MGGKKNQSFSPQEQSHLLSLVILGLILLCNHILIKDNSFLFSTSISCQDAKVLISDDAQI